MLGFAGRSSGGDALIVCSGKLYVIEARHVLGFDVQRLTPAKGGGGAWLEVQCATGYPRCPSKRLTVASADGTHDLDEAGPAFAAAFGKRCMLGVPYADA